MAEREREKVFDAIRNCVTEPKCKDCPWKDCEKDGCKRVDVPVTLLLDALKLLKEQEAKQVKLYGKEEWVGFSCACPDCKARWMGSKSETHFCPNCGRQVKWE